MKLKNRLDYRKRRHMRLRHKIRGSDARPRMCVRVTGRHMYVQFVDDGSGVTLAALSTAKRDATQKNDIGSARGLGKSAAEIALAKGIKNVVFDRGGNRYSGRVKAIAESAREAGLKI